mmetsp:Transcript_15460/g.38801  ORF Transcript_15460/g.38801 Transcript_15460/m.38801 type:complete len:247 (+) Transcript_15460:2007-2747(+)
MDERRGVLLLIRLRDRRHLRAVEPGDQPHERALVRPPRLHRVLEARGDEGGRGQQQPLQRSHQLLLGRTRESFREGLVVLLLVHLGEQHVLRDVVAADDLDRHLLLEVSEHEALGALLVQLLRLLDRLLLIRLIALVTPALEQLEDERLQVLVLFGELLVQMIDQRAVVQSLPALLPRHDLGVRLGDEQLDQRRLCVRAVVRWRRGRGERSERRRSPLHPSPSVAQSIMSAKKSSGGASAYLSSLP